ncbi:MAG: hypothetical protein H7306_16150 [Bacteriovorax sp.]|nr:hypothetical protein [Rhizobacter sp.]
MSLMSFFGDTGEKRFGHKPAAAAAAAAAAPDDAALQARADATNQTAAIAIAIATQNLTVDGLDVGLDGAAVSAIAEARGGNANAYVSIFETNKPMLGNPDRICPGQMLRIAPV